MHRYLLLAAVLLSLLAANAALAYGTISTMGQNREHERITRHALSCALAGGLANCFQPESTDNLAGKSGTFGAVGAPDNPARGLLFSSEAHCDNGDYLPIPNYAGVPGAGQQRIAQGMLLSCRAWMEANLDEAVADARAMILPDGTIDDSQMPTLISCTFLGSKGRAKCNVLEDFGLTLHASEDFYSHTNWTDRPNPLAVVGPANPPGLGNGVPAPWLDLRVAAPPFPPGLMSGCFTALPEAIFCNSGPGGRVKHHFLNKDTGQIDPTIGAGTTPRGMVQNNFGRSVQVAITDTQDKWATLQERLLRAYPQTGALMICALTHDDPKTTCVPGGQRQGVPYGALGLLLMFLGASLGLYMTIGRGGRRGGLQPG